MIKNWLVRGDCHGSFHWMSQQLTDYTPEETAVILLGDAGLNFYLNKTDERTKREVEAKGFYLYLVRGNHECRPQNLEKIEYIYDENVQGIIMYEPLYPHIRYFKDFEIYIINGYRCLVIGGAYSVDKWWRLARAGINDPAMNIPKKTGWFSDECLSAKEMALYDTILAELPDKHFDFVFSHTCPKKFQPMDLFLNGVDQSKVDESMEIWMDKICEAISFDVWCFGHYHRDRIERPYVEQYFNDIERIEVIAQRWQRYRDTGELDWWLVKGGLFDAP